MKMTMPIEQHGTFRIKGSKQKTENRKQKTESDKESVGQSVYFVPSHITRLFISYRYFNIHSI